MISTITSTQVFNALSPIIRKNITQLYVYKLRNYKDLEAVLEELSALTEEDAIRYVQYGNQRALFILVYQLDS